MDRYELKVLRSGEPSNRDKKYGDAVIITAQITSHSGMSDILSLNGNAPQLTVPWQEDRAAQSKEDPLYAGLYWGRTRGLVHLFFRVLNIEFCIKNCGRNDMLILRRVWYGLVRDIAGRH